MITGSTPGAIKQRAHRAYVTLRQLLGRKEIGMSGGGNDFDDRVLGEATGVGAPRRPRRRPICCAPSTG